MTANIDAPASRSASRTDGLSVIPTETSRYVNVMGAKSLKPAPIGEQPAWNPQRPSAMPVNRYEKATDRTYLPGAPTRNWVNATTTRAPLWSSVDLRDGNQALVTPMSPERKLRMFRLLVELGFKSIEVGYPSASQADFDFVRQLIVEDLVPDDVTIGVFTPARPELIDRTFESLAGAARGMVHLCNATACLWREAVFGMTAAEVAEMALTAARRVRDRAEACGADLAFEYSPETFNVTEPDFVLELCDRIADLWSATPSRPVTLNLPSTVETDSPTDFADQIEWMHRNLARRDSIILSVHPHNDRGTAVASAELALRAGADRVEGTLFGNGERTGNVCLATLALNLFSHGIDPQLDFSDVDEVRRVVEDCNQIPVHPRHPYVGELVYTAFSGTHQDAIAKGLLALQSRADDAGRPVGEIPWSVPYLPIDPHDVGRSYEAVVRVNSQSGKGGISHVLRSRHGLELPKWLAAEFAGVVQRTADVGGAELAPDELVALFQTEFLDRPEPRHRLTDCSWTADETGLNSLKLLVGGGDDGDLQLTGEAAGLEEAIGRALSAIVPLRVEQAVSHLHTSGVVAYVQIGVGDQVSAGAAVADTRPVATAMAAICALDRWSRR